jgi:hypothetical protein
MVTQTPSRLCHMRRRQQPTLRLSKKAYASEQKLQR